MRFLFVSLIGFSLFFGINLSPDSFSYMEAANNSLRGYGFVVNCNLHSASGFQPLYSYLMIPFIYIWGYSTNSLLYFHVILFILTYYIYDRLISNAIKEISPFVRFLSIIITIYPIFTILLSETLLIALIGLYLNLIFFFNGNKAIKCFIIIILLAAILLTKNSAIFLIIPLHLCFIDFKKGNKFSYYLKHFIYLIIVVMIFIIMKILLKSTDSHEFVFGGGLYSFKTYLAQIYRDISVWIFGISFMRMIYGYGLGLYLNLLSSLILVFILAKSSIKSRNKFYLFLVYAVSVHLFVFCNVWIDSELNGRFLFWFKFIFIFMIIYEWNKKYMKILYIFIIVMNLTNIVYSRFKTYNSNDVVLKLEYALDSRIFVTKEVHYPSLFYDEKNSNIIIISPAYPWYIDK